MQSNRPQLSQAAHRGFDIDLRDASSAAADPDQREEWKRMVSLGVDSMEPGYRRLYDLYYRRGYSVGEISRLMSRPEGTIKYDLYMLRKKIRDMLAD